MTVDNEIVVKRVCPMFSRRTLAEYLAVNKYTVRDLQQEGRLPPPDAVIGNRPRWYFETIDAILKRGRI